MRFNMTASRNRPIQPLPRNPDGRFRKQAIASPTHPVEVSPTRPADHITNLNRPASLPPGEEANRLRHLLPHVPYQGDPQKRLYYIGEATIALAKNDPALESVLWDANTLVDAAMSAYRGVFPIEAPYHFRGGAIRLPWFLHYFDVDSGEGIPESEIAEITDLLFGDEAYPTEPPRVTTSLDASYKGLFQACAFQVVICMDGCIDHFLAGRAAESLRWSSTAHRNLIDLTLRVAEVYRDRWPRLPLAEYKRLT
jgi:hypothetical protein